MKTSSDTPHSPSFGRPSQEGREWFSSISHLVAALFSIAGLTLLVVFASLKGSPSNIVGLTLYGISLVLLYLSSGIYHATPLSHPSREFFHRLDHIMIYVLIAGTYTPIALGVPGRGWGWTLFGVIWGLALIGVCVSFFNHIFPTWIRFSLYLIMGWIILPLFFPVLSMLPPEGRFWLFLGGILYTIGSLFFALEKKILWQWRLSPHDIFHLFVIAGSVSHFWFMLHYLLPV